MSFNIFQQTLCSGDIYPLKLSFKDQTTGNPKDMTGSTVGVTVKTQPDDQPDTTVALWWKDIPGDTTGVFQFYVAQVGTSTAGCLSAGDYWLDCKMWQTSDGNQIRTTVFAPLQMHIIQSVTARTTP